MLLGRRTRVKLLVAIVILAGLASITLRYVLAPPPQIPGAPMPLTQYGVVRVYASIQFTGTAKILVTSQGSSPFFVSRLTLFLNRAADFDILLDSISIDQMGTIQISGFLASSKVVVVPAGLTVGEVVSAMPSFLSFLVMKDPMGNDAIVANSGDGGGLVVGLRFMSGAFGAGTVITAVATVVAPSNSTVSMAIS